MSAIIKYLETLSGGHMMWNQMKTDAYEGMIAETVIIPGNQGESIRTYFSRPLGVGPFPGLVLVPHMPGWDEWCRETARRFSQHGYQVLCPDIFGRFGSGTPSEVSMIAREAGGVHDSTVLSDCQHAVSYLRNQANANGKVGIIGMCSGGRHAFLAACKLEGLDAVVDCWGGGVVAAPESLTPARPVAPIDYTADLKCPLLGIFGNDDRSPTMEQVDVHEEELRKHGKDYEFHRYEGAGHGFWYYHGEAYRPVQAMDSWQKTFAFLAKHLQ